MNKRIIIDPELSLSIWKCVDTIRQIDVVKSYFHKNRQYSHHAISEFEGKYVLASKQLKDLVAKVDSLICQELDIYALRVWGLVPDLSTVEISDKKRGMKFYIPPIATHNAYTVESLSEILYGFKRPSTVMFLLSENCNLRCKYCFENHESSQVISEITIDKDLRHLFSDQQLHKDIVSEENPVVMEFMGGEPLLHVDLIRYAISRFYHYCLTYKNYTWLFHHKFNITTNGTLYFTDEVQKLLKDVPEVSLAISLDGTKECHDAMRVYSNGTGSFDNVIKAVKQEYALKRLRVPKMTFNKDSIKYVSQNVEFMYSLGYSAITYSPALESEYSKEDALLFYEQLLKVADFLCDNNVPEGFVDFFNQPLGLTFKEDVPYCGGEGSMITFAPDGYMYTCHRYKAARTGELDTRVGKGLSGFRSRAPYYDNYRKILENGVFSKPWEAKCLGCPFKGKCLGCPAISLEQTGRFPDIVHPNGCLIQLAKYAAAIYYRAKRYGYISQKYFENEQERFSWFLPNNEIKTLIELERMMTEGNPNHV